MNIVNVGYDSTNYYILANSSPKLLIDVGWPGTLPKLQYSCKRMGIKITDIKLFLVTHYHPDHAGLAQELKKLGSKLIVLESQLSAIPTLRTYMKQENHYIEIDPTDNVTLEFADSRSYLLKLGINGEIIPTPGHSDDSVSLILDEGAAFTGDLQSPAISEEVGQRSWTRIRSFHVKTIYPGHGPSRLLPAI